MKTFSCRLLFFFILGVSINANAKIYREVSPSGHVTFTDRPQSGQLLSVPEVKKIQPVKAKEKNSAKWVPPNKRNRTKINIDELKNLTDHFNNAVFEKWLSSSKNCRNHFQRVDLQHNNMVYFFTKNIPLVIPIVNKNNNLLELNYSRSIKYQYDTKKNVLLHYRNNANPRVLYICEEYDVDPYFRDGYDTYLINQKFISGHSIGHNIEIRDGSKFLEKECRRAYEAKEYEVARSVCGLAIAKKDNMVSKYYMGMLYRFNYGGDIDYGISFKHTHDAAIAGFSPAYSWLAWHYNFGKSIKKDYEKALRWYIAAVDAGELKKAKSVADFYLRGKGVQIDYEQAAVWLLIAARAGDSHAQNKIGSMFANGVGVKQDYKLAHHWILKSHQKNNVKATFNLAVLYDEGKIVKDGKSYASVLYKKAAERGIKTSSNIIDKLDRIWVKK